VIPASQLQVIANYSSLRLIDSMIEGLLLCLFAALLLRLVRRQNAATRFAVGFSTLLAIALLPLTRSFFPHNAASSATPSFVVPESWALYLFSGWAAIAILLLARVARSVWHLHKLRSTCVPIDSSGIDSTIIDTLRRKRMRRSVTLCTSERVRVPTALGLVKPAIVIPRWVMQDLSAAELNQVVLHELAHLRRWDDWTNLAQQIVKALFFFHPAVWWIEKKISLEREMACDDAVLTETQSPRAYAQCLAHLAERSFVQRGVALAQALVGRVAQTSQRVAQILDVNRPKGSSRIWKPAVSAMAGVLMLCSAWLVKTPELVGFEGTNGSAAEFAGSLPQPISAPVINAGLVQHSKFQPPNVQAVRAKISSRPAQRKTRVRGPQLAVQSQNSGSPIHLTSVKSSSVPVSETLFVFIENGQISSANAQVYRIQMWHVVIVRAADAVDSKTPSKKT
jgi:beta-lactamase regulating signal transducer with metallopeptidase domain